MTTRSAVAHQPIFVMRPLISRSAVCEATNPAANGMTMTVSTIITTFPMSTRPDGDPLHNVSSAVVTATGAVNVEGDIGRPQCGQAAASVETSWPQSGQVVTGMEGL